MSFTCPIRLSGFQLKYIALLSMTLDHFAAVFFSRGTAPYFLFRLYGRIAFPIFCFLLAEGFFHTSNVKAYLKRLFLFALISEIPFDMALYNFPTIREPAILFHHQNVFFTLFLGLFTIWAMEHFRSSSPLASGLCAVTGVFAGYILNVDYGAFGVMTILLFYGAKELYGWMPKSFAWLFALVPLFLSDDPKEYFTILVVPLLLFYNGTRGRALLGKVTSSIEKYLFYWYYPLHLLIFALIAA